MRLLTLSRTQPSLVQSSPMKGRAMSRLIPLALIALLSFPILAHAGEKGLGVGLIVGEPTGVTAKKWLTRSSAIVVSGAYSFGGSDELRIQADYLVHNYKLLRELVPRSARSRFSAYYGIGARMRIDDITEGKVFDDDVDLGIRFPLGLGYRFREAPLGVFVEFVPVLDVSPDSQWLWRSSFGVRYYFK